MHAVPRPGFQYGFLRRLLRLAVSCYRLTWEILICAGINRFSHGLDTREKDKSPYTRLPGCLGQITCAFEINQPVLFGILIG